MLRARVPCFAPVWCWSCARSSLFGGVAAGRKPARVIAPAVPTSELRAAIDADGVAGDPTRVLRGEERHNRADIVRLADPLESLHAESKRLARVGLEEVRHVGVDRTWCDRVNADAAWSERRRKVLHQCVDRAFRGRVG